MKRLITFIALACSLHGCIFAVGVAAGAAAVAVVYDHRTIGNAIKDTHIANKVANRIKFVPGLANESHVEVTVFNKVVLLTGQTPNPEWRQQAAELAKSVSDVTRVYNQISVEGPTSSLTRTSDSWITAKIRAEMLTVDNLRSGSIKVVTESGVVYLMGIVRRDQANLAADIARQVSGVQKVVKIFQYKD